MPVPFIDTALGILGNFAQDLFLGGSQVSRQKELMDYQNKMQLDLWNKTNYPAQVKKLKEAGLNPALLYGKGGGGGATVGAGMPSTGQTPPTMSNGGIMELMQFKLQQQLTESEVKKNEADANLSNTRANKESGVDTDNTIADTEVKKAEAAIKRTQAEIQGRTVNEQINIIGSTMQKIAIDVRMNNSQLWEQENSAANRVKQGYAEMLGSFIENRLKEQNITESKERVNKMAADILQGWSKLGIEEKRVMYEGMNWETNQFRAQTEKERVELEKFIKNVPDSDKLGYDTMKSIISILLMAAGKK